MLRSAAAALAAAGIINASPAQINDIPSDFAAGIEAVQELVEQALQFEVEEISIPVPEPEPEKIQPFGTTLGTSTTSFSTAQKNRTHNIKLAAGAISGIVLEPGETFSFNTVVGKRTEARGYKAAGAFANGEKITEVGGGICQVSSTLFHAALYADMQITNRVSHGLPVGYLPPGLDATVSWGGPEFKFKNPYDYPVKITAGYDSAKGTLTVNILGPEDEAPPNVRVTVTKNGQRYITKRSVDGIVNYTATSYYK